MVPLAVGNYCEYDSSAFGFPDVDTLRLEIESRDSVFFLAGLRKNGAFISDQRDLYQNLADGFHVAGKKISQTDIHFAPYNYYPFPASVGAVSFVYNYGRHTETGEIVVLDSLKMTLVAVGEHVETPLVRFHPVYTSITSRLFLGRVLLGSMYSPIMYQVSE